jgi:formate--tetrahydrofolate ligase
VVAINHFIHDRDSEIAMIEQAVTEMGGKVVLARHWAQGGAGAEQLAQTVVAMLEQQSEKSCELLYPDAMPLLEKIRTVAQKLYGASDVISDAKVLKKLSDFTETYGDLPVCMAKTPYSFSSDPSLRGAPDNHSLTIRDVRLSHGAGFVVVLCGDIMTMPGLPRHPASERIDIDDNGVISGLF